MSKAPPIPSGQDGAKGRGAASSAGRRPEIATDPARGNAGLNLKEQGRFGNIHQNLTHQGRQQDR